MQEARKAATAARPYLGVVFMQCGVAGMEILSKAAMNRGMSVFVLVFYRYTLAALTMSPFALLLERKTRPKMTFSVFAKILALTLLEPVMDQNLYYLGMKYTSATFAATMCNIIPAITFLMAWIVRLEKVKVKSRRSQAKIAGTAVTVGSAMVMSLAKGPVIGLPWTKGRTHPNVENGVVSVPDSVKGALMITTGCVSWSAFVILQAITLEAYPAELSLTAWICVLGAVGDAIVALVMERGDPSSWSISWDLKLLSVLYSGTVSTGLLYYVQGLVIREKGPVFVTAFSPLSMVVVAAIGSVVLAENLRLGSIVGAMVIVTGLYLMVWGKSEDHVSNEEDVASESLDPASNT